MVAVDEKRLGDLVEQFYRAFLAADRAALAKVVAPNAAWIVSDELLELINRCCRGRSGAFATRPRRRPDCVIADRGYDHGKYRRLLRRRGVKPVIARRQTEHGSGLGVTAV